MSNYIFDFIRSLNKTEIKSVQDYLKIISELSSSNIDEAMQLKLFAYLIDRNNDMESEETIAKVINTKNISSLKNELIEKISEALILNRHIHKNPQLSSHIEIIYKLKKELLFLRISGRNNDKKRTTFILRLFSDIINKSKKNEAYDVLVEALTFQKYYQGIRAGKEEFDKINKEIEFYDKCNKAVWNAVDCYYSIILNNDFIKTHSSKIRVEYLKKSIKQLEKDYKLTKSYQVLYYLQILKFAYFEEIRDYKKAIKECEKMVEILKGSSIIYTKERLSYVNENLARYFAFEGNYKKAIKTVELAQDSYNENSFMYLISKESEFYLLFYNQDFEKALVATNFMIAHELSDSGKFRRDKFIFYKACVYFSQNKIKESSELIRSSLEIEKDKSGWNVQLRLLSIMIFIVQDKIDEISFAIDSLRKYIERAASDSEIEIRERDKVILILLREWEKAGFTANISKTKIPSILIQLDEKEKPHSWAHFGNELIPFHTWLKNKLK